VSTTLTSRPTASEKGTSRLRLDPVRHRRRPALAVGSLALVVACVAVFVSVYLKAGNEASVLAVDRVVPQGQVVQADDLTVVRITTNSSIATVPAADASAVVGRRAADRLEPDSLLSSTDLVTAYAPPAGMSIVGVAVKEGQLPATGVAPGETVDVVLTGLPGAPATTTSGATATGQGAGVPASTTSGEPVSAGTVIVPDATVLETASSSASSGSDALDVSLLTASSLAPLVATASAAGQVALIVVAPGT
jgi:hypothetical protein